MTTEADKPRPYSEHLARAINTHDRLCAFAREAEASRMLNARAHLDVLRASAAKGFWLYPLVEAARGIPR